jgi:hypothetical protein
VVIVPESPSHDLVRVPMELSDPVNKGCLCVWVIVTSKSLTERIVVLMIPLWDLVGIQNPANLKFV